MFAILLAKIYTDKKFTKKSLFSILKMILWLSTILK